MKKHPAAGARQRARILRREATHAEKRLWQVLRSRRMGGYRFRRQAPIGSFIADFVCHEAKMIIEVDGGQHDLRSQAETGRTHFLQGQGYRVLRFWNNEVLENPDGVQRAISEDLARAHPHPNPPPSRGRAK